MFDALVLAKTDALTNESNDWNSLSLLLSIVTAFVKFINKFKMFTQSLNYRIIELHDSAEMKQKYMTVNCPVKESLSQSLLK